MMVTPWLATVLAIGSATFLEIGKLIIQLESLQIQQLAYQWSVQ